MARSASKQRHSPEARGTRPKGNSRAQPHDRKSGGNLNNLPAPIQWPDIIPAGQWANYRSAIEAVRNTGLPFLLGGGFGLAVYTGRWRNTKDIDFYIHPRDREAMIAALSNIGFVDYFEQRPYDPGWIYRSFREGIIVDIIWSMANRRAEVDENWFERAETVVIRDETIQVVSAEDLVWCKSYILQRDHCDWPDIFNLFFAVGTQLDWNYLLERLGDDVPLLRAALTVFGWLCPERANELPARVRRLLELPKREKVNLDCRLDRLRMLDSRAWFASQQPRDKYLEV
jgi:hypothetical protein